jgi:hypothetical protein
MKLVDTEIPHREDDEVGEPTLPPRPEKRRVHTSLLFTFAVLVGTVVVVYGVFPKRDNQILTVVIAEHEDPSALELERPDRSELSAWTLGVLGRAVPWPDRPDLEVVGARVVTILKQPAALVRYRAGQDEVTLVAMRPREAVRRKHHRETGVLYGRTWRRGRIEFAIVGPHATRDRWGPIFGVP